MLGVIVVHDEAGVNHAWDPAQESQEKAQDETQNPASHQNRDWRQYHTEKITERFQWRGKFRHNPLTSREGNR